MQSFFVSISFLFSEPHSYTQIHKVFLPHTFIFSRLPLAFQKREVWNVIFNFVFQPLYRLLS